MKIQKAVCRYVNRPLAKPFGFKGGYANYIRTVEVEIVADGITAKGESAQGVLWSDKTLHERLGEDATNETMFSITKHTCNVIEGMEFDTVEKIFDYILDEAGRYAHYLLTYNPRKTFILNALVPIDNAIRMLYARKMNDLTFDTFASAKALGDLRHEKLGVIPLITYNMTEQEIKKLADSGIYIFKIKIGADPDGDDDKRKMVEQDKKRISEVHEILKDYKIPHTDTGKIAYYLDANGRYDTKFRLQDFLNHTKAISAFEHIMLLEEPFDESNELHVGDFGVKVACDEALHDEKDAKRKIEQGYTVFALKPIAKTITVTNRIVKIAKQHNIGMFCADLTVPPMLVEINKNYAARLPALKGLKTAAFETNGAQNYKDWVEMTAEHPMKDKEFVNPKHGLFTLDDEFYQSAGGIFLNY